ncbi:unnamed protein product (macronuclear) [Paramecium tetraurelia]|uniref:DUF4201 domain-containing protein n=1 Tax=Paramecium tetraurelia TaxID=5888 RepID=A0CI29_PARTE|nr:uncharacterized protein GSPATT00038550001 [Paramecium tetraurelia]CAK70446.1 unnamed protein product [Paramecium tetraurelia]|eukprot:XP_001437843.1 hypothetical protein (macronuclear) [Paramecium tetraurelia strain d4-2]
MSSQFEANDQMLQEDDSQFIEQITQKLTKIRNNLGIDIYDQENLKTPQSEQSGRNNEHNTFGREKKTTESKINMQDVQELNFITSSKHKNNHNINNNNDYQYSGQSGKEEQPYQISQSGTKDDILPQQISFLQNKLEALKQIYPTQGQDQASFLERENVYLKIELELKSKQERFLRQQLTTLTEEYNLKQQQLQQSIQDLKQQHEEFVYATDLTQDIKQYILSLESDLHLTKGELDLFTQRLAKEQSEKEMLQNQLNNIHTKAKDEFQKLYEKAFKELQFMCQALSSELLTEQIDKKVSRISQQTNLSKMYQDLIDEKMILETKIDNLENQLESYQNKQFSISYAPSIKSVYEKRLHVMKQGLLHWKTRTQQIEQIVLQWIQKLKQENQQLKTSLVKKQNKMFVVFENLLREIYQQFEQDKYIQMEEIKKLQEQKVDDQVKITKLRSTIQQQSKTKKR